MGSFGRNSGRLLLRGFLVLLVVAWVPSAIQKTLTLKAAPFSDPDDGGLSRAFIVE